MVDLDALTKRVMAATPSPEPVAAVAPPERGAAVATSADEPASALDIMAQRTMFLGKVQSAQNDPIDFMEAAGEGGVAGKIPVVASIVSTVELAGLGVAALAAEKGSATPKQQALLEDFFIEAQRPYTWRGKFGEVVGMQPAFWGEFWLAGGVGKLAYKAARKKAYSVLRKRVSQIVRKRVSRTIAKGAAITAGSTVFAPMAIEKTMRRTLPAMGIGEDSDGRLGVALEGSVKSFMEALPEGLIETAIEVGSEYTGGVLMKFPPFAQIRTLQVAAANKWLKLNPAKNTDDLLNRLASKTQWHGLIGEMLEEEVGKVGRTVFLGEEFKLDTMQEFTSKLAAFALPGAAGVALRKAKTPAKLPGKERPTLTKDGKPLGTLASEGEGQATPAPKEIIPKAQQDKFEAIDALEDEEGEAALTALPDEEKEVYGRWAGGEAAARVEVDKDALLRDPEAGPAVRRYLEYEELTPDDVTLVEPTTEVERVEEEQNRRRGVTTIFVDAGQPLSRPGWTPGKVGEKAGVVLVDVNSPQKALERVVTHELVHAIGGEKRLVSRLEAAVPGLLSRPLPAFDGKSFKEVYEAAIRSSFAVPRKGQPQGPVKVDVPLENLSVEGATQVVEALKPLLREVIGSQESVAALGRKDLGLLQKIYQAVVDALRKVGIKVSGPIEGMIARLAMPGFSGQETVSMVEEVRAHLDEALGGEVALSATERAAISRVSPITSQPQKPADVLPTPSGERAAPAEKEKVAEPAEKAPVKAKKKPLSAEERTKRRKTGTPKRRALRGEMGFEAYVRAGGGLLLDQDTKGLYDSAEDQKGPLSYLGPIVRPEGKGGRQADMLGEAAHEMGWFKERPTVREVLDAIDENLTHPQQATADREADAAVKQRVSDLEDRLNAQSDEDLRSLAADEGLKYEGEPIEDVIAALNEKFLGEGRFAAPDPLGFYSDLRQAIEDTVGKKGVAVGRLRAMKTKHFFQNEEWDWSEMDDLLRGRKGVIPRDELIAWLDAHELTVEETVMGGEGVSDAERALQDFAQRMEDKYPGIAAWRQMLDESERQEHERLAEASRRGRTDQTKHSDPSLQLPGGENYREVAIRLPVRGAPFDPQKVRIVRKTSSTTQGTTTLYYGGNKLQTYGDDPQLQPGGAYEQKSHEHWLGVARKLFETGDKINRVDSLSGAYTSGHYGDIPNVLAHIRFNERTDAKGRRVLFVEEIQSDWHQTGVKKGYQTPDPTESELKTLLDQEGYQAEYNGTNWVVTSKDGSPVPNRLAGGRGGKNEFAANLAQVTGMVLGRRDLFTSSSSRVPDAPFKTTWPTLALKRMVRWGAENGFDAIGWTTGAQQVERYETALRAKVDEIKWRPIPERPGTVLVDASKSGGGGLSFRVDSAGVVEYSVDDNGNSVGAEDKTIEDIVGKSIAERILAEPSGSITGDNLTIGGKGMESFYDKHLVASANKLARKFDKGVKVEMGRIPVARGEAVDTAHRAAAESFKEDGASEVEALRGLQQAYPEETPTDLQRAVMEVYGSASVHILPISESMRTGVMEKGFGRFAAAPAFVQRMGEAQEGEEVLPALRIGSITVDFRKWSHPKTGGEGLEWMVLDEDSIEDSVGAGNMSLVKSRQKSRRYPEGGEHFLRVAAAELDPDYRRRGIYSAIQDHVLENAGSIKSDSFLSGEAQRFYRSRPGVEKGAEGFTRHARFAARDPERARRLLAQARGQKAAPKPEPVVASPDDHEDHEVTLPDKMPTGLGWVRRGFTSAGDLPKGVFIRNFLKDAWIRQHIQQTAQLTTDLKRAVRKVFGRRPSAEALELVDLALKDPEFREKIPEPLQAPVQAMRDHIKLLSNRLINSGMIEGDLVAHVAENLEFYATRSYRAYDDPKWKDKVPVEIRNRFHALVREQYPELSENQVQQKIRAILYEASEATSPLAVVGQGKIGSKDLSTLMKRKHLSKVFREFLGEYEDPYINYARSVAKMAHMLANHEFLTEIREDGMGTIFWEEGDPNIPPEAEAKIAADASHAMAPLNGLFTTPEVKRAFEETLSTKNLPPLFQAWMKINSLVKANKTVGSLMTHVRNFFGNPLFAVAQGHWRVWKMGNALKTTYAKLSTASDPGLRKYILRLTELGVIGEAARAGELREMLKDAAVDIESWNENRLLRMLKAPTKVAMELYAAEDDVWKVYAFENEKARYARTGLSGDALDRKAAEIVRNSYPTYSLVPGAVQKLRRAPIAGSFVSFPSEVYRTTYHTAKLVRDELRSSDPAVRSIGAQRLAGVVAASTVVGAMAWLSRVLVGITGDDDEKARVFMPPWSKNSDILWLWGIDGTRQYVDLSYTDPFSYIRTPIRAALRGDDPIDAARDMMMEALDPYISEELFTSAVVDIARNKKKEGGEIYNESGSVTEQANEIRAYLVHRMEPGTLSSMRRVWRGVDMPAIGKQAEVSKGGKKYDAGIEALAVLTGVRRTTLDVSQSLYFVSADYARSLADATSMLTSVARSRGGVTDDEIRTAHKRMERTRREAFNKMHDAAIAAQALGLTRDGVGHAMRGRLSEAKAVAVLDGKYSPYVPNRSFLGTYKKGASEEQIKAYEHRAQLVYSLSKKEVEQ